MYTVHVWGFSITSTIWDPSNVLRNYILFNLLVAKKYVVALLCCTVAKVICLPGNQAHWLCVCIFIIHHSPVSTLLSCRFCSIWCWIWFKPQKLLKCEPGAVTSHLHVLCCWDEMSRATHDNQADGVSWRVSCLLWRFKLLALRWLDVPADVVLHITHRTPTPTHWDWERVSCGFSS